MLRARPASRRQPLPWQPAITKSPRITGALAAATWPAPPPGNTLFLGLRQNWKVRRKAGELGFEARKTAGRSQGIGRANPLPPSNCVDLPCECRVYEMVPKFAISFPKPSHFFGPHFISFLGGSEVLRNSPPNASHSEERSRLPILGLTNEATGQFWGRTKKQERRFEGRRGLSPGSDWDSRRRLCFPEPSPHQKGYRVKNVVLG